VLKPAETGVPPEGPLDARALRVAAGVDDPLGDVCPVQLRLPAAPPVAAAAEGTEVDLAAIRAAWLLLRARHDVMLVEGAGGLLVPLTEKLTMADFAREIGLPLVVVARAALGTINHTLLTLEAAERRGLTLAGVVISHASGSLGAAEEANLGALRAALGERLAGEVPHFAPGAIPGPGALDLGKLGLAG
jgi:dethiobiotin synthetase